MDNKRPQYNQLLNELKSQLPIVPISKDSEIKIHLIGDYSSSLKKRVLHELGYTPKSKKIGKDFIVVRL